LGIRGCGAAVVPRAGRAVLGDETRHYCPRDGQVLPPSLQWHQHVTPQANA